MSMLPYGHLNRRRLSSRYSAKLGATYDVAITFKNERP